MRGRQDNVVVIVIVLRRACTPVVVRSTCCRPRCRDQRRCSPATLITIAIALAALYVAALIIGHALLLFVLTRWRAHVHRPPLTLPSLVDCCLFTPAIAANVITVAVAVATATTIADLVLLFLTCWEYFFPELATDINFK